MKALVATINCLLLVDLKNFSVKILESNRREYYGISWWQDQKFPVLSHSTVNHADMLTLDDYANSEKGYLSMGDQHSAPFLSAPHQILCAPNHWVITTNTGRNAITLYDNNSGFYKDIRINDVRWDRLSKDQFSGEHFNSLFLKNDNLYVLAHGFNKSAYVLEYAYPQMYLKNKYPIKHHTGLHNIWVDDAQNMIACHSTAGELIDIKTNESLWSTGEINHTRGLAVTADLIIVGESDIASRTERAASNSALWLIDRKTMQTQEYFYLGPYGGVHEVRLLDVPDEAHHGIPFANVAALEQWYEENKAIKNNQRVKTSQSATEQKSLLANFEQILGSLKVKENNWLTPQGELPFALLLFKKAVSDKLVISLEYDFTSKTAEFDTHLSLVMGYKGKDDANMLAFFLVHKNDITLLELWENVNEIWNKKEVFNQKLSNSGKVFLHRNENEITLVCNATTLLRQTFSSHQLNGQIGVRSLNASFRDYTVVDHQQIPNPKKIG